MMSVYHFLHFIAIDAGRRLHFVLIIMPLSAAIFRYAADALPASMLYFRYFHYYCLIFYCRRRHTR